MHSHAARSIVLLAASVLPLWAAEPSPSERLALVDGTRGSARLVGFLPGGKLEFEIAGANRSLAPSELILFGARREISSKRCVLLADGSLLAAESVRLAASGAAVESKIWGIPPTINDNAVLKLPLEQVRAVIYQLPAGTKERDALFDKLTAPRGDDDRLLLENGDVVAGTIHLPDELPEAARAGETFTVETRVGAKTQKVEVLQARVAAIRFNPTLLQTPERAPAGLDLALGDGTFLRQATIGPIVDGLATEVSLASGIKLPVHPLPNLASETVFLRYRQERVVYLDDLAPAAFRHWPFLTTEWPLAHGRNVLGGRLRAGGLLEDQGLGMHSRSRAIYAVPPGAKRFEAEAALDDAAGPRGSVIFRVLKLTGQTWSVAAETPLLRGGDARVPLALDVAGVDQIALVVEFGDRGDQCDWANWLGARFVK